MPDEDYTFSGSLVLDLEFDDVTCTRSVGFPGEKARDSEFRQSTDSPSAEIIIKIKGKKK